MDTMGKVIESYKEYVEKKSMDVVVLLSNEEMFDHLYTEVELSEDPDSYGLPCGAWCGFEIGNVTEVFDFETSRWRPSCEYGDYGIVCAVDDDDIVHKQSADMLSWRPLFKLESPLQFQEFADLMSADSDLSKEQRESLKIVFASLITSYQLVVSK